MVLDDYLAKLNTAVAEHNREVDECVECGQLMESQAIGLRWMQPITREMVETVNGWPAALLNIVGELYCQEHAQEVIRLAKAARPTTKTQELLKGAGNSKGGQDRNYPEPMLVKVIDMAHLVARAESKEKIPCVT